MLESPKAPTPTQSSPTRQSPTMRTESALSYDTMYTTPRSEASSRASVKAEVIAASPATTAKNQDAPASTTPRAASALSNGTVYTTPRSEASSRASVEAEVMVSPTTARKQEEAPSPTPRASRLSPTQRAESALSKAPASPTPRASRLSPTQRAESALSNGTVYTTPRSEASSRASAKADTPINPKLEEKAVSPTPSDTRVASALSNDTTYTTPRSEASSRASTKAAAVAITPNPQEKAPPSPTHRAASRKATATAVPGKTPTPPASPTPRSPSCDPTIRAASTLTKGSSAMARAISGMSGGDVFREDSSLTLEQMTPSEVSRPISSVLMRPSAPTLDPTLEEERDVDNVSVVGGEVIRSASQLMQPHPPTEPRRRQPHPPTEPRGRQPHPPTEPMGGQLHTPSEPRPPPREEIVRSASQLMQPHPPMMPRPPPKDANEARFRNYVQHLHEKYNLDVSGTSYPLHGNESNANKHAIDPFQLVRHRDQAIMANLKNAKNYKSDINKIQQELENAQALLTSIEHDVGDLNSQKIKSQEMLERVKNEHKALRDDKVRLQQHLAQAKKDSFGQSRRKNKEIQQLDDTFQKLEQRDKLLQRQMAILQSELVLIISKLEAPNEKKATHVSFKEEPKIIGQPRGEAYGSQKEKPLVPALQLSHLSAPTTLYHTKNVQPKAPRKGANASSVGQKNFTDFNTGYKNKLKTSTSAASIQNYEMILADAKATHERAKHKGYGPDRMYSLPYEQPERLLNRPRQPTVVLATSNGRYPEAPPIRRGGEKPQSRIEEEMSTRFPDIVKGSQMLNKNRIVPQQVSSDCNQGKSEGNKRKPARSAGPKRKPFY